MTEFLMEKAIGLDLYTARYDEGKDRRVQPSELSSYLGDWNYHIANDVLKDIEPKADLLDGTPSKQRTFDQEACVILHKGLLDLGEHPELITDDRFWRYLAMEVFAEVLIKRTDGKNFNKGLPSKPSMGAVGLTSLVYNRIYILWMRANMLYDADDADPYRIATLPFTTDEFESGILRHRYAFSSTLAKTLARFQRPDGVKHLHTTHKNGVRELYKRLRQLHGQLPFEMMEEDEIMALLARVSADADFKHEMDKYSCPCNV